MFTCPLLFLLSFTGDTAEMEKASDAADLTVLFFSADANLFKPRAQKEKCVRRVLYIRTGAQTGAVNINNAFFMIFNLQIFHSFIGHLRCFVANFLVPIILGLFCICAI